MTDDRPSPDEQAEAEALALALEGVPGKQPPPDALEAAGLLELDGQAMSAEREQAVWERIEAALPGVEGRPARPAWRRWLLPVGSVALAAAAALALVVALPGAPGATALPRPDPGLLQHQAEAASGADRAAVRLDADMRAYRANMFASLRRRYGGRS